MAEPIRSGPELVRPANAVPPAPARYFSASSNATNENLSSMEFNHNASSAGMVLEGSQSIRISDSGVYFLTYSMSFRRNLSAGNTTVRVWFSVDGITIPGSSARGGSFVDNLLPGVYGTVSKAVIRNLTGADSYLVDLMMLANGPLISTDRTMTAHRIAT